MVENIPRLTSGNRALILGIALALPLAGNAQTFGYEESEGWGGQGEAESVPERSKEVGTHERTASAVMAVDARKEEQTPVVRLSPDVSSTTAETLVDNDSELDAIVTQVAREAVERVELLDGQSRSRSVVASVDLNERLVTVRLDKGFVPSSYGAAFEDQQSLISNAILHVAEKVEPLRGVKYLYGGYDIHHYFPEVKAADDEARRAGELRRMAEESRAADWGAAESYGDVDEALIHLLEKEASRKVSAHVQAKDVLRVIGVKVTIDVSKQRILADIGEGYRPEPDGDEMFLQELAVTLRHHAEQAGFPISDVDIHFQGHPLKYYYPEELKVPPRARNNPANQTAMVSAGHGLVRVHPALYWDYQRPVAFGFREDMITPAYGDALQRLLEERSTLTVHRARSRSMELHPDANRPWEQMSSRYHIKALLPDRGDLWNSLPNLATNDREVKEDIRVRPLYANHMGAGTMISLHTNGNDSSTVRGVEVYYHVDKPGDRPLATSVLCGMRELIRAQPGYENFPVREGANAGNHGENRIGTMPSVLVEIAYHSNPEDSAALQDPIFRTASMKGVEKGIRLFREGKTCEPFVLSPLPDVSLPTGTSKEQPMVFAGNPQFPVTMEFTTANCSKPGACKPSKTTFDDPNAPIKANMRCHGTLTGTARWSVVLRDVDGVATAPVEFQQTCHKPGAA